MKSAPDMEVKCAGGKNHQQRYSRYIKGELKANRINHHQIASLICEANRRIRVASFSVKT